MVVVHDAWVVILEMIHQLRNQIAIDIVQDTIAGGVYINAEDKYFTISPQFLLLVKANMVMRSYSSTKVMVVSMGTKTYHNSDRYPDFPPR